MTHPELTAVLSERSFSNILMDGLTIAKTDTTHFATRLVACWNACREMDDPAHAIAELNAQVRDNRTEIDRLNNLVAERNRTIGKLRAEALVRVCADPDPCTGLDQPIGQSFRTTTIGPGIETTGYVTADGTRVGQPTPEHLAYQLLRSLILSSAK